jgi:hypothetical protein
MLCPRVPPAGAPQSRASARPYDLSLSSLGGGNRGVDPHRALCPFELHGTCNDDECRFQHTRGILSSSKEGAVPAASKTPAPKARPPSPPMWKAAPPLPPLTSPALAIRDEPLVLDDLDDEEPDPSPATMTPEPPALLPLNMGIEPLSPPPPTDADLSSFLAFSANGGEHPAGGEAGEGGERNGVPFRRGQEDSDHGAHEGRYFISTGGPRGDATPTEQMTVASLEARVGEAPGDVEAWVTLALHLMMGKATGPDALVSVSVAEAVAWLRDGGAPGEAKPAIRVLARALEANPHDHALLLLYCHAFVARATAPLEEKGETVMQALGGQGGGAGELPLWRCCEAYHRQTRLDLPGLLSFYDTAVGCLGADAGQSARVRAWLGLSRAQALLRGGYAQEALHALAQARVMCPDPAARELLWLGDVGVRCFGELPPGIVTLAGAEEGLEGVWLMGWGPRQWACLREAVCGDARRVAHVEQAFGQALSPGGGGANDVLAWNRLLWEAAHDGPRSRLHEILCGASRPAMSEMLGQPTCLTTMAFLASEWGVQDLDQRAWAYAAALPPDHPGRMGAALLRLRRWVAEADGGGRAVDFARCEVILDSLLDPLQPPGQGGVPPVQLRGEAAVRASRRLAAVVMERAAQAKGWRGACMVYMGILLACRMEGVVGGAERCFEALRSLLAQCASALMPKALRGRLWGMALSSCFPTPSDRAQHALAAAVRDLEMMAPPGEGLPRAVEWAIAERPGEVEAASLAAETLAEELVARLRTTPGVSVEAAASLYEELIRQGLATASDRAILPLCRALLAESVGRPGMVGGLIRLRSLLRVRCRRQEAGWMRRERCLWGADGGGQALPLVLAMTEVALQEYASAQVVLERAITRRPYSWGLWTMLLRLEGGFGRGDKARATQVRWLPKPHVTP